MTDDDIWRESLLLQLGSRAIGGLSLDDRPFQSAQLLMGLGRLGPAGFGADPQDARQFPCLVIQRQKHNLMALCGQITGKEQKLAGKCRMKKQKPHFADRSCHSATVCA